MIANKATDKNNIPRLAAGRAGELTNKANTITFDLLEKIFGFNGPYRNALKEFGIKINDTSDSFLVLQNSQVLTDLNKEEKIIWSNYPVILVDTKFEVLPKFSSEKANPVTLFNYAQKALFESGIVLRLHDYVTVSFLKYKNISEVAVKLAQNPQITISQFCSLYKDIVFVSYLYEFLSMYNHIPSVSNDIYADYIRKNDYLLADNRNYIEYILKLPYGFYLDDYPNLKVLDDNSQGLEFIPATIDKVNPKVTHCITKDAEIMLQCLKNNLRLKTNVLLYALNLTTINNAKDKGIYTIADKKFSDLV